MTQSNGPKERCDNCRFAKETPQPKSNSVFCRRYPPTLIMMGMQQNPLNPKQAQPIMDTFMVATLRDNWCGEWQQSLPKQPTIDLSKIVIGNTGGVN